MSAFAVVRDATHLTPACDHLSALLTLRLQQCPASGPEPLLGVWVDSGLVEDIPSVMTLPDKLPSHRICIRESSGLPPIWTLYWFDAVGEDGIDDISRDTLLLALFQQGLARRGMFVPVFRTDAGVAQVRAEMDRLHDLHLGRIMAPLFQDVSTGGLSPLRKH